MLRQIGLVALLALVATPSFAASLAIKVSGVSEPRGEVGCALHTAASTFPMGEAPRRIWVQAGASSVTCRFDDVPPGVYAVAVSHDLNGNRKTDTNLLGLPTEAWGVSNNARPALRAPRFDEATFAVPQGGTEISVRIAR